MSVVDDSFDHPLKLEEGAVMPMAGGLMQNGYQCGMLWGAALAAGAQAYRLYGAGPQAESEALITAQRLVKAFAAGNRHINCSDIIRMNWKGGASNRQLAAQFLKFFLRGGPAVCFGMSASYAKIAVKEISLARADDPVQAPCSPVSCAAQLARQMGASDLHTVMAAGLAGGIGLSGGACGALGAAIWLNGMGIASDGGGRVSYDSPVFSALIERFLESSDYEFECAKIVGRQFEDVTDHADYVQRGGCSKIIADLAVRQ